MRQAEITRDTTETKISLRLELDGSGKRDIQTGIGFFDHMLELFTAHGRFNLYLRCDGDLRVDGHHTVEDVGIALGKAFAEALGDKAGIFRYGDFLLPMDEALVQVALDISGRAHLCYGLELPCGMVGGFDVQLALEFFESITRSMGLTLHLRQLAGTNRHHILEAAFKGFGRALAKAVAIDPVSNGKIPSTKGIL